MPAAGVDDDRQPMLVGRTRRSARRPGSPSPNRSARGCSLIPAAPRSTARSTSRRAAVDADRRGRTRPAGRPRRLRRGECPVVGGAIATGFGEREHDCATVDGRERSSSSSTSKQDPSGSAQPRCVWQSKMRVAPSSVLQAREPRLEQLIGGRSGRQRRGGPPRRPGTVGPWAGEDVSHLIADVGGGLARGHR